MAPVTQPDESDSSKRKRLVESLSQSFPDSALSKMLRSMDPNAEPFEMSSSEDEHDQDPLSASCFSEIHLDKVPKEELDDELTSLSWLQDNDVLKSVPVKAEDVSDEENEADSNNNEKENIGQGQGSTTGPQQHPPHIPYNPQKHIHSKPPYSFSCLIFMAVEDSAEKRLPVKDIYSWILAHFPFFQNAPTGWKNSVRHNLSLNKCFKKVDKDKGQSIGKGSLWCIDPDYRPNLLQALRKTPYHPYHQLQLANPQNIVIGLPNNQIKTFPLAPRVPCNTISPRLFPFLSKRLNTNNVKVELDSDIDVANTLVSLKVGSRSHRYANRDFNNPRLRPLYMNRRHRSPSPPEFGHEKQRRRFKRRFVTSSPAYHLHRTDNGPVVITSIPSEDHTYSANKENPECSRSPMSDTSSIDDQYDFDIGCHMMDPDSDVDGYHSDMSEYESETEVSGTKSSSSGCHSGHDLNDVTMTDDEDETQKIVEGADALLNLAGIKTSSIIPIRSISPNSDKAC